MVFLVAATPWVGRAQLVLDFENGMKEWEIVDEPAANLGEGPCLWEVRKSQLGLKGNVLFQSSNCWGTPADSMLMGGFAIYKARKFRNFVLTVEVAAQDNDGMGLVWAYTGTDRHYRVIMINDVWPEFALDNVRGPLMRMDKRVSNDSPWYQRLALVKNDYKPYPERTPLRWTLTVLDGKFTFEREDKLKIEGTDPDYVDGYIGVQVYAHQAEFDNFRITEAAPVDAKGKLTTAWATLKSVR
jgi:hypothetical protein